jgi:hypothetical protein
MTPELQEKLHQKYPDIFIQKDLPCQQTCMCWGIGCGDGWYGILDWLCSELRGTDVVAVQVKEKFGGLRFYVDGATKEDMTKIDCAEGLSNYICEKCGSPIDVKQTGAWIRTLCKECRK